MANPSSAAPANPLDQLRAIHLPEPVSWWPMAPGWWLLIVGGGLLSAWLIRYFYRHHSTKLYRRQALEKLNRLKLAENSQQQLRELFELLKQTANSAYPNHRPGSLGIEQFIHFLQSSVGSAVFESVKGDMDKALYSSSKQIGDGNAQLFEDAKTWIKQHPPEDKLELANPC